MSRFPLHMIESAPADSKLHLLDAKQRLGFVPNVYAASIRHAKRSPACPIATWSNECPRA